MSWCQEIIASIKSRLVSISISPRSDIFSRDLDPVYEPQTLSLSDLRLKDPPYESLTRDADASPSQVDGGASPASPVETRLKELLREMREFEEQEVREREIRNRRLERECESRIDRMHRDFERIMDSVAQEPPTVSPSNVTNRLREVECKKKQLIQEKEQQKQQELQREIRSLVSGMTGDVRRAIKSLQESVANFPSLHQHVREAASYLSSMQSSTEAIACKTSFTDEDRRELVEARQAIVAACSTAQERVDALVFAAKQQEQQAPAAAAAAPLEQPSREQATTPAPPSTPAVKQPASSETVTEYLQLRSFVNDFEAKIKAFVDDPQQKAYRLRLQQFIRTQINAISPDSNDHLKQKFQKLRSLFQGREVEFQEKRLHARDHPLAVEFSLDYAAKTFVSVGSKQVLSVPRAAFSFAAIVALLWHEEPRFGQLFLGHLLEKCPYVGAYYPPPDPRESEADYLICCGYVYAADSQSLESEESFLNRMRAYVRLYGAVLQSRARHAHGIRFAWIWMARTLRTQPRPGVSAAVLHAFLDVCLFRLLQVYKNQCVKLMRFLASEYIPSIERHSSQEVKKQALVQLKMFVADSLDKIRKNKSLKHEGLLSDYFWQKSYLNS